MYRSHSSLELPVDNAQVSGARSRIVALFSDMRGFSSWSETQPLDHVAHLIKAQFERVIQISTEHHHSFHKFLGDGFVLLWEPMGEDDLPRCLAHALAAAFHLHDSYWRLSRSLAYPTPAGYGVGISVGEAIRIQPESLVSEMNEVDFVGYPLNCAARMQTLAAGYGTVICSSAVRVLQQGSQEFPDGAAPVTGCRLTAPGPEMIQRAAVTKGLKPADRTGFRCLSFTAGCDAARWSQQDRRG